MRVTLLALALAAAASPAAAQTLDIGASMRLENERRWTEGRLRALDAEIGRIQADQTVRRLEARRAPDPTLSARQGQLDAVEADALLRATEAVSTDNAARLRSADPAYDRRLRDLGFATGLPPARR